MKKLTEIVIKQPEFQELLAQAEGGHCPVAVSGLSGVHRAHIAAAMRQVTGCSVVLLCSDEKEGARLQADLAAFTGAPVRLLAGREFVFYDATASRQWEHRRLDLLYAMSHDKAPLVVATVEGLLQRTLPPELLEQTALTLSLGDNCDLEQLTRRLVAAGYTRCDQVEGPGQFALRGNLLDVFSPAAEAPVRTEFWGDEIDTMGLFDPATQRRTENISTAVFLPATETLPQLAEGGVLGLCGVLEEEKIKVEKAAKRAKEKDRQRLQDLWNTLEEDSRKLADPSTTFSAADRYLDLIYPDFACGLDYLPQDAFVFWCESARCMESGKNYQWRLSEDVTSLTETGILRSAGLEYCADPSKFAQRLADAFPTFYFDSFLTSSYPTPPKEVVTFTCRQLTGFGSSLETAVSDLKHYENIGMATVVLCQTQGRAKALADLLREQGVIAQLNLDLTELPQPGFATLAVGGLSSGMEYQGYAVITEGTALHGSQKKKTTKAKAATNRQKIQSYNDLVPGDLVVHEKYGIARFVTLSKMQVDGVEKDYIQLAYAGADTLYVPATQLDLVSKFIGGGENPDGTQKAKLSKLGGTDWAKAKSKAKKATKEMAKQLIALYAQRQRQPGYAFHSDDPWQREFEDKFPFQETDDQLRCVQEIKADMERPVPMDRLLCGDVGYGKTEIALRAVMKCVLEGKQAAILVPTTVLANQHFQTATRRFQGFPVRICVLTRYQNSKNSKSILQDTAEGKVDILIGTHRLLQKSIQFKDLGLLVIDEEQRFGVTHKERLKELAKQVDVLTLSATPIPRTLNMALSGLRDMSVIDQPPQDRQPVQTYVLEHNWSVLMDAIRREIGRGGQVYYLHNRVETIEQTASKIRAMLDDDSIVVDIAHGQMTQEQISSVMARMVDGEVQILVCTTIIETGIDIPNVNTLVIEDADRMGLAQLHQIRGRVGRSSRRAYAYLTYRKGKILSEVATKRLTAVREFAAFGAGFKIAMRDLEIRGAGNLLGREQSGNLMSVGYDMYLKLLEEAVLEERGETPVRTEEVTADLVISANIPSYYVPAAEQRMDLYRRIAKIRKERDADDVVDELIDRYGDPPRAVNNLISVALLRSAASDCGIQDIAQKGMSLRFTLKDFDTRQITKVSDFPAFRSRVSMTSDKQDRPVLALKLKAKEDPLVWAKKLVEEYANAASQKKEG